MKSQIPRSQQYAQLKLDTSTNIQHLLIARGSCEECKYLLLLLLSKDLHFIENDIYEQMRLKVVEIGKMLNGLINSLRK